MALKLAIWYLSTLLMRKSFTMETLTNGLKKATRLQSAPSTLTLKPELNLVQITRPKLKPLLVPESCMAEEDSQT